MATLFCVRPATRNIGNDLINRATADLLRSVFGPDTAIVNLPALRDAQFGGFTASQVYDMNRLADGVVLGGGNLFENGQLTVDLQALEALHVPLMIVGLSHGRIFDEHGTPRARTDAMPPAAVQLLAEKACELLVRDDGSRRMLHDLGVASADVGGCPTLFLPPNAPDRTDGERVLVSIRHPARMSVPPPLQWRVAEDLRRLLAALENIYGDAVHLVCHDYRDLEFARAFPGVPMLYFDDAARYEAALRDCRLSVTYRLHAFLPCLAFGVPSVHLSYDERGAEMVATAGMTAWDVDLLRESDVVEAVLSRIANLPRYHELRAAALGPIAVLHARTLVATERFAARVGVGARVRETL
ncbi:MAG: polysaccharide pyruvyl transferase family protein [Candidatus Eremiobacteraeota bacterium]|nr:polysaccharide pyruvyl transferase family protein [Candidatus Eremiobacteraeota bacterium]MBV9408710.1 polysaccharide pyruvyl transferase family protein [Candidatus Eremiobacteraeota bacterium]